MLFLIEEWADVMGGDLRVEINRGIGRCLMDGGTALCGLQ